DGGRTDPTRVQRPTSPVIIGRWCQREPVTSGRRESRGPGTPAGAATLRAPPAPGAVRSPGGPTSFAEVPCGRRGLFTPRVTGAVTARSGSAAGGGVRSGSRPGTRVDAVWEGVGPSGPADPRG